MTAKNECIKSNLRNKATLDFSKVGGLLEHLQLLREIIVLPLIYADLYSHFSIKAPKGVLFYGPPGTGKTLVAGALANELSKEGHGRVQFFSRKGADVLDKYVGESERKLRDLFEKAAKYRPSIIFFDELDGLAPTRSQRNDQVHSSVVATLLSLMDGLNNIPGVIVIGATNRVDAIDPALRRPGRFDRELYFPIPCTSARKDILAVHVRTWLQKPSPDFLSYLAETTAGYTGSDIQALCAEAFLCCVKRLYPTIYSANSGSKVHIDKRQLKVEERDFLTAKQNITPWTQRSPCKMKKLSECIRPLLQRQLNKIFLTLTHVWPQFTSPGQKLLPEVERCIGRILLLGSSEKGLNLHIVPALLQAFEHLPIEVVDAASVVEKPIPIQHNIASILLLSRVHDWWDSIDDSTRNSLTALLEDMHPSSPLLIICTCDCYTNLPETLQKYFSDNSALVIHIENPTSKEREEFFKPLFFGKSIMSIQKVLYNTHNMVESLKDENVDDNNEELVSEIHRQRTRNTRKTAKRLQANSGNRKKCRGCDSTQNQSSSSSLEDSKAKRVRYSESNTSALLKMSLHDLNTKDNASLDSVNSGHKIKGDILKDASKCVNIKKYSTLSTRRMSRSKSKSCSQKIHAFTTPLTDLVNSTHFNKNRKANILNIKKAEVNKQEERCAVVGHDELLAAEKATIKNLFNCVMQAISGNYTVSQLELLYDTISACIYINRNDFRNLHQNLNVILENFKNYLK